MPDPRSNLADARFSKAGLPRSYNVHWSDARKRQVVRAVQEKLITFDEARWNYLLSKSEFETWQKQFSRSDEAPKTFELH